MPGDQPDTKQRCDWAIIALLAVGAILLVLILMGVLATLGPGVFYTFVKDFQTLIGAAVGFGGLILVTRQGFREARKSREHQAEIDRGRNAEMRLEEENILAGALYGELVAMRVSCTAHIVWMHKMVPKLEDVIKTQPWGKMVIQLWPHLRGSVFEANVGRIGILGKDIAHELAWLYGSLFNMRDMNNDTEETFCSTIIGTMKDREEAIRMHIINIEATERMVATFIARTNSQDDEHPHPDTPDA